MKTLAILSILILSACAPGFPPGKNGVAEYEYIGCHEVFLNPSPDGNIAFGPFGFATKHIYFQQKRSDGSVPDTTTSFPCD